MDFAQLPSPISVGISSPPPHTPKKPPQILNQVTYWQNQDSTFLPNPLFYFTLNFIKFSINHCHCYFSEWDAYHEVEMQGGVKKDKSGGHKENRFFKIKYGMMSKTTKFSVAVLIFKLNTSSKIQLIFKIYMKNFEFYSFCVF